MKKLTLLVLLAGMSLSTSALSADKNNNMVGFDSSDAETLRMGSRPRPRPPIILGEVVFEMGSRPRPRPPQASQISA